MIGGSETLSRSGQMGAKKEGHEAVDGIDCIVNMDEENINMIG